MYLQGSSTEKNKLVHFTDIFKIIFFSFLVVFYCLVQTVPDPCLSLLLFQFVPWGQLTPALSRYPPHDTGLVKKQRPLETGWVEGRSMLFLPLLLPLAPVPGSHYPSSSFCLFRLRVGATSATAGHWAHLTVCNPFDLSSPISPMQILGITLPLV